jgi:hypothetical protein
MTYTENYNIEEIYFEGADESQVGDTNTFLDWLNISKKETFNKHYKIKHQQDLISSFIQTAPKIQPVKALLNGMETDLETKTGMPKANQLIVSETLAKIYYEQKKYNLALETYKKLRLVYPEKSSYFAALMKEIEKELHEGKV